MTRAGAANERELDHRDLRALTTAMLDCCRILAGTPFPADPYEQLLGATDAVFRSWDAPKATSYRQLNAIAGAAGTGVTVQTMVFDNVGGASGADVAFTRDPATGADALYSDIKFNAQGGDVVAGRQKSSPTRSARPTQRWAVYNLAARLVATLELRDLGMPADGIGRAADVAMPTRTGTRGRSTARRPAR